MPGSSSNPYTLTLTKTWRDTYPGATAGILAMTNATNSTVNPSFEEKKAQVEQDLRARFSTFDRVALAALPTLQAYDNYYKKFKKTYHVFLQLESVALKGKSIPRVNPLVEAMFMAELKNQLLTAGHDLATIQGNLTINAATGKETYVLLNGQNQMLKVKDMMITDDLGVISSVIYGPDQRTRIRPETQGVIYTIYAPPGINEDLVYNHLEDIRDYALAACPEGNIAQLKVYGSKDRAEFDLFSF